MTRDATNTMISGVPSRSKGKSKIGLLQWFQRREMKACMRAGPNGIETSQETREGSVFCADGVERKRNAQVRREREIFGRMKRHLHIIVCLSAPYYESSPCVPDFRRLF